jgi:hypothetical protein
MQRILSGKLFSFCCYFFVVISRSKNTVKNRKTHQQLLSRIVFWDQGCDIFDGSDTRDFYGQYQGMARAKWQYGYHHVGRENAPNKLNTVGKFKTSV